VRSIGDGLKVLGEVEAGIDLTTGVAGNGAAGTTGLNRTIPSSGGLVGTGNQIFSRQAYAGISSDSVGTITVGRQYSGSYIVTAAFSNALGAGFYGNSITFIPVVGGMPTRLNSSVVYRTPNLNGFTGQLTYAFGSENNISTPKPTAPGAATSTTDNAGVGYDLAMFYKAGSFSAALGTWDVNAASYVTAGETGLAKRQGWQGAVNYDFGVAKVYATYISGTIKGGNYENVTKTLSDSDGSSVSVSVPFGKHKFYASYARLNDKSLLDRSANSTGVAYSYDLYKNTRLYGSWGKISNNSNAFYSLANGGDLVGNVTAAGSNATGFMVGLNSSF
jgi:predicted porin